MSVRLNMDSLVRISNLANESICIPIAHRIAAKVYDAEVEPVEPRTSAEGWARTKVSRPNLYKELNSGRLARALGEESS